MYQILRIFVPESIFLGVGKQLQTKYSKIICLLRGIQTMKTEGKSLPGGDECCEERE